MNDHPNFYLGSKEHVGEWQRPRACYVRRAAPDTRGTQHVWLRIDPPVAGDGSRAESSDIVIGPHFEGDVLWPQPRFPTSVYVYLAKSAAEPSARVFDATDFDLVAWCEIYATRADADESRATP